MNNERITVRATKTIKAGAQEVMTTVECNYVPKKYALPGQTEVAQDNEFLSKMQMLLTSLSAGGKPVDQEASNLEIVGNIAEVHSMPKQVPWVRIDFPKYAYVDFAAGSKVRVEVVG